MGRDKKENVSGSGKDGEVEANRTFFYLGATSYSRKHQRRHETLPLIVYLTASTYFLTRPPPPPFSPHSDLEIVNRVLNERKFIRFPMEGPRGLIKR